MAKNGLYFCYILPPDFDKHSSNMAINSYNFRLVYNYKAPNN